MSRAERERERTDTQRPPVVSRGAASPGPERENWFFLTRQAGRVVKPGAMRAF